MAQKKWHGRVVAALREIASGEGRRVLSPSEVIFRVSDGRSIGYRPDCMWAWGTRRLHLVLWEVENSPSNKQIPGDVALAALTGTRDAEIFVYQDPLGSEVRKPIRYVDLYDYRRIGRTIPSGYVRLPIPMELHFRLVCRTEGWARYLARYVELLADRVPRPFDSWDVVWTDHASAVSTRKSLLRNGSVRKLLG